MANLVSQLRSAHLADHIIARDSVQALSAADLFNRCEELANTLTSLNIQVLALHADNSVNWLVTDLACQLASICLIPLPTFFSAEQLRHVFHQTAIDAILCEQPGLFSLLLHNHDLAHHNTLLNRYHLLTINGMQCSSFLPANTQKITFTSGSTGTPKGVCLSNQQLIQQALTLSDVAKLQHQRHLCLLPLSTLLENVAGAYMPLLCGGEVIIPTLAEIGFSGSSSLDANQFCQTISKHQPNSIIVTPQLLTLLVTAASCGWMAPPSLQFIAVGGSRVSHHLLKQAHDLGLPVYEGYGLSECASVVSLNSAEFNNQKSSGKPLPHIKIEIENNEIIVSGSSMLGYVGEPDSWNMRRIHTGDLGHLDENGYLIISGRKKNLLISSFGRNINPEWVESELLADSAISECIVFGDARPYCIALLSPHDSEISDKSLQQLIDNTNARLPDYARVKKWLRLPQPLRTQQDLITENGHPKREVIATTYAHFINSLYPITLQVENL